MFAYVYPSRPYDVYLCPTFFGADVLGTDSRAGTLVHELSHFTIVADTRDHRYGQSATARLAADDPDRAIENADNLEYFAENTPPLPTLGDGAPTGPDDPDPPTGPAEPTEPVPESPPSGRPGVVALSAGTPVRGALAEGEIALFRAERADALALRSLSGDADLYVFDNPELDGDPVCSAAAFSAQSTLDACELPAGGPWHAAVVGFEGAEYEIAATVLPPGASGSDAPAPEPTPEPERGPAEPVAGPAAPSPDAGDGGGALGAGALALLCGVAALRRRGPRAPQRSRSTTVAMP